LYYNIVVIFILIIKLYTRLNIRFNKGGGDRKSHGNVPLKLGTNSDVLFLSIILFV